MAGDWDAALGWVDSMRSSGLSPTAFTFTAMCRAAGARGDVDAARASLELARRQRLDLAAYTNLIKACADADMWAEVGRN